MKQEKIEALREAGMSATDARKSYTKGDWGVSCTGNR